jgi:hypothetical protein
MNKSNFNLLKALNEYYYININNNNVNNYKDTHSSAEHSIEYISETVTGQGCPAALPCPALQGEFIFFALPCLPCRAARAGQKILPC